MSTYWVDLQKPINLKVSVYKKFFTFNSTLFSQIMCYWKWRKTHEIDLITIYFILKLRSKCINCEIKVKTHQMNVFKVLRFVEPNLHSTLLVTLLWKFRKLDPCWIGNQTHLTVCIIYKITRAFTYWPGKLFYNDLMFWDFSSSAPTICDNLLNESQILRLTNNTSRKIGNYITPLRIGFIWKIAHPFASLRREKSCATWKMYPLWIRARFCNTMHISRKYKMCKFKKINDPFFTWDIS